MRPKIGLSELNNMLSAAKFEVIRDARKRYGKAAVMAFEDAHVASIEGGFSLTCPWRMIVTVGETREVFPGCISVAC